MRSAPTLLAAALLLATAGCQLAPGPAAGGWESTPVTGEVREAAAFAFREIAPGNATLARVEHAEQQVVAGMNFRFDLTASDGRRWQVLVWRKLDGSFALASADPVTGR